MPKVNSLPMSQNAPNLVTLAETSVLCGPINGGPICSLWGQRNYFFVLSCSDAKSLKNLIKKSLH
jgi:hypothetical protein